MRFLSVFAAGLAIVTSTLAVDCQGVTFTDADVDSCVAELCNWDAGKGPGGYPHKFNNREGLNLGAYNGNQDIYEYPLFAGSVYTKGNVPFHHDPHPIASHRNDIEEQQLMLSFRKPRCGPLHCSLRPEYLEMYQSWCDDAQKCSSEEWIRPVHLRILGRDEIVCK